MYPLCSTCAFAIIIYILNYNVFPCALLVYNYNSLNQCDLSFYVLKCDLDELYGDVDMFIWLYWFLHLICIDDIYDKYYVWPLTFDWRQFCELTCSSLQVMSLSRVKVLEFVWG